MREKYDDENPNRLPLSAGFCGEWVWNSTFTWMLGARSTFEAGLSMRRLRDEGFNNQYVSVVMAPRLLDGFKGSAVQEGGYAQQSWTSHSGQLHLTAEQRWDDHSMNKIASFSPSASASWDVTRSTNVHLAWGEYAQYPEISVLTWPLGSRGLPPLRSVHTIAGLEQRMGRRTRLRAEFYNRADRDLWFQPLYDPRVLKDGSVFNPPVNAAYSASLRGYARGVEFFLQHSSANRLTGWISYAYGGTGMRDGLTGQRFPSDLDQHHTVNVYAGYRIRPTVNVSLRWTLGSGFPIPGYLGEKAGAYFLTENRNQLRLSPYSRTDVRINKAWTHDRWKMTLYGEVVNLTNRSNYVYESFDGYNGNRQAWVTLDKMFPILPLVGVVFEP